MKKRNRSISDADNSSTQAVTRRDLVVGGTAALATFTGAKALLDPAIAQQPTSTSERSTPTQSRFTGRVAIITGAARGIGRATALRFAQEGAAVVLVDLAQPNAIKTLGYPLATAQDLAETERLVKAQDQRCLTIRADVRKSGQMRAAVEQTMREFGQVDIMVANAGILPRVSLAETTDEVWQDCLDINLTGVGNALRAVVPHMAERKSGRIVAVASEFARRCLAPERVVYTASKWGVIGLVKAAALELSQTGITVNAVSPGFTRTGMTENAEVFRATLPKDATPTPTEVEAEVRRRNIERHALPIGFVEPEDIASAILYLASDEARYITGFALDVTGGFSPQYTA